MSFSAQIIANEIKADIKPAITHELESLNIALPKMLSTKNKRIHSALVKLWQEWAMQLNIQPHFIELNYEEALLALDNGDIDVIAIGQYEKQYKNKYYFSLPLIKEQGVLYQLKSTQSKVKATQPTSLAIHGPFYINDIFTDQKSMQVTFNTDLSYILAQQTTYDYIYSTHPNEFEKTKRYQDYQRVKKHFNPTLIRAVFAKNKRQQALAYNEGIRKFDRSFAQGRLNLYSEGKEASFEMLLGHYLSQISIEQQEFLIDNPVVTYGIVGIGYPPYQVFEDGVLTGLTGDKQVLISKRIGITFEPVFFTSFDQAQTAIKEQKIDFLPLVYKTEQRRKYYSFTTAIGESQLAIISRHDDKINSLNALANTRIAVIKGHLHSKIMENKVPSGQFIYFDRPEDALLAINNNQADAYIGELSNAIYLANNLKLNALYFHMSEDFNTISFFRMATTHSNAILKDILNLGLSLINDVEAREIKNKWINTTLVVQADDHRYQELIDIILMITALIIITLVLYMLYRYRQKLIDVKYKQHIERALEEARKARDEAEQSASAKTDFLARMSHEIRTPMNGVLGMAEAMSFTRLKPDQSELLDTLNSSAKSLMTLLNDILDFSKMDAGKLTLESTPINLEELANAAMNNFRYKAESRGLQLNINIDDTIKYNYLSDPTRLLQVLNNLISNSIKFTEHGFIQLSIRQLPQSLPNNDKWHDIVFEIKDSGIGIAQEKTGSLFTPFVQAEQDTTRKFGGTGLGLSICKEIIDTMAGTISVSSIINVGSLFTINVPLAPCLEQPKTALNMFRPASLSEIRNNTLPPLKVLLAEDNPVNRKVIAGQLKQLDIQCDIAENGLIAYQMYQKSDYDIILSDCHMPEMDGFTLASMVSTERKNNKPWLIAITADALEGAVQSCMDSGFDDYLAKPCPISSLKAKLEIATSALLLEQPKGFKEETILQENDLTSASVILKANSTKTNTAIPTTQHLNRETTLELTGEDIELTLDILEAYLTNNDDFNDLIDAHQQSQLSKVKDIGHKIKSAIRYLGANELANIAETIEEYSANEKSNQLNELIETLGKGLERLTEEVNHWCDEIRHKEAIK
ncbi:ATP-binding protein [Colwellia piezophila]|uniref:ATP-binding protein n=1 Tax=Colwellia piezophila TaxID=211668 RepID=UPI0012F77261|nr:transporter substrate-binding domain-containing protein [Colwellia piezophila]